MSEGGRTGDYVNQIWNFYIRSLKEPRYVF